MKLLVLASWYPNSKNISAGIFIKHQVRALHDAGVDVSVFYPFDETISQDIQCNNEDNITTYRSNCNVSGKVSRFLGFIKSAKQLSNIIKKDKIDIVHVHSSYPASITAYLCKLFYKKDLKYIITEHRSNLEDYFNTFYSALVKNAFKSSVVNITVNSDMSNIIKKYTGRTDSIVMGNMTDVDDSNPLPLEITEEVRIVFAGNMESRGIKRVDDLLKAIKLAQKDTEKILKVTLIGDGVKRSEYEQLAQDLGIGEQCNFTGYIENSDAKGIMQNSHFMVLASAKETFGVVLIENMAKGRPVIATKCSGPLEFVTDKVGKLVEIGNIEELASAILEMIENYHVYDCREVKRYVSEKFSYKAITSKLIQIYDKI